MKFDGSMVRSFTLKLGDARQAPSENASSAGSWSCRAGKLPWMDSVGDQNWVDGNILTFLTSYDTLGFVPPLRPLPQLPAMCFFPVMNPDRFWTKNNQPDKSFKKCSHWFPQLIPQERHLRKTCLFLFIVTPKIAVLTGKC